MLAARRVDVADLNHRARTLLHAHQQIGDRELHIAGCSYAVGDRVVTLRNDRQLALVNGHRGTVARVDPSTRSLIVNLDGDEQARRIPAEYLDDGHVDHAYAMTIHKAQGLTCDRAYTLGDTHLSAEAGYTALTRGRHENHLYVAIEDDEHATGHHDDDQPDGVEGVRRALQRSTREHAAIDLRTLPNADTQSTAVNAVATAAEHDTDVGLGW